MIKTRISQTMSATNIGTTLRSISFETTAPPWDWWLRMAIDTPHQVSIAFIVAASIQAANRYQISLGSFAPDFGSE